MDEYSELQEPENDSNSLRTSRKLLCKLCGKRYDNPKLLKCQHSFCKECLKTYISNAQDNEKGKSDIQCPTCSELMTISLDGSLPDESSAEVIEDDIILTGVIDILNSIDSDTASAPENYACGTIQWPADDDAVPMLKWRETAQNIPKCKQHGKDLEYFCKSHERILCTLCVIRKHKTCDEIVECQDVKEAYLQKTKVIGETACVNRKVAETLGNEVSERLRGLFENRECVKTQVRMVKDDIIKMLNEAESTIYSEIDETCNGRVEQYEERLKCCNTIYRQSQLTERCMGALKTIDCPNFVVNNIIECEKSCESERLLLEEITCTTHESKLNFTRSAALESLLQSAEKLGHLTVSDSVLILQNAVDSLTINMHQKTIQNNSPKRLKQDGTIDCLLTEDKQNCWITGVAYLKNDSTVVVDRNNDKIKMFSKDLTFLHAVKVSKSRKSLFGVTVTKENKIAVTLSLNQCVQFVSISGDKLIPIDPDKRLIVTKQPCFGITSGLEQLFVYCVKSKSSPCCIKVFDSNDCLLRDIVVDNKGNPLFSSLSYSNIAFDTLRNRLSVVDQPVYRQAIVTLELNGSLESRDFMPYLRDKICGLAYMDSDLLMVLENRTLCLLSDNGAGENVVTEINTDTRCHCPCALAINMTKDRLALSQANPTFNYKSNNILKCFVVQK